LIRAKKHINPSAVAKLNTRSEGASNTRELGGRLGVKKNSGKEGHEAVHYPGGGRECRDSLGTTRKLFVWGIEKEKKGEQWEGQNKSDRT